MKLWLVLTFSFLVLITSTPRVFALTVTSAIPPGALQAQAEYLQGDSDKPAVLILHGFLTTNRFHTVRSMAQAFHDAGYSVLTPTLTLGITQRQQSVKCNSIHTHTLEQDIHEVETWIEWLKNQGHQKTVLVGHSSGSQELLAMLAEHEHPEVPFVIFTSMFYLSGPELGISDADIAKAEAAQQQQRPTPHKYSFLFCKNNYYATPNSYLSYTKINREYVLNALNNLKIPHYTIMGSADKRYQSVGQHWLDELKATGTQLIVVEGANHFFSSEYEFDLQDHLVQIMQTENE